MFTVLCLIEENILLIFTKVTEINKFHKIYNFNSHQVRILTFFIPTEIKI